MRYQLIAHTSNDDTLEVDVDADDAATAVAALNQLLRDGTVPTVHGWGETYATGTLTRVYARPLPD